jgi:predicted Rossmann fold flavoprotein
MNREVVEIKHTGIGNWELVFRNGAVIQSDFVCIASGGFPKLSQFDWLKRTGHSIVEPVPSLFTFNIPKHPLNELMGVSVPNATVKIQQTKLKNTGPLLITHWGLSGPCVLKLSAWGARELQQLNYHFTISVNWLGDTREENLRTKIQETRSISASKKISNSNIFQLPNRLWQFFLQQSEISDQMRWADMPAKAQNKLIQLLINHELHVAGKTTFKEEFVTSGGVSLKEIDANTMQSKLQFGLFFAGEILDVDGITGGFNFQHAWTSGYIAAKAIAAAAFT